MENFKLRFIRSVFCVLIALISLPFLRAEDSAIVLGPIEGELAKKQIPIDLGRTPKVLVPLISKPIFVHGGLRLASEKRAVFLPPSVPLVAMIFRLISPREIPSHHSLVLWLRIPPLREPFP